MYFYRLGYYSHEDSSDTTLLHENLYSKDELNELIAIAFAEVAVKENARTFKALPEYLKDAKSGGYIPYQNYSSVSHHVVKYMIEHQGFTRPYYTCEHFIDGWKDLLYCPYEDSDERFNKEELTLSKKIKEKWLQKFKWFPKKNEG